MRIVEKEYSGLYASLFMIFVIFGTSSTLIGAALPKILLEFHWSYAIAGAVIAASALGSFLANYATGRIIGRFGPKATLGFGLGLNAAATALFAASPSPALNALLSFAIGFGQGFLEVGVNWSVLRMDKSGSGKAMSLMHGGFSVGAVLGPFATGLLMSVGAVWTAVYRCAALLFALLLAAILALPLGRLGRVEASRSKGAVRGRGPVRLLGFATLLFYVGVELGISNWSAEYFARCFGLGAATAAFVVSIYWGGLSLGRFGFPFLFRKAEPGRLLIGLSILLSLSVGLLAAAGLGGEAARPLAFLAVALSGLGSSCVYPMVISLVGAAHSADPGPAIGFASTGGALGSFSFPFLMSAIAGGFGIKAGFFFYAALAVIEAALAAALVASLKTARAKAAAA
jgi:fucose permease